jgi:hypothetical protein
MPQGLQCNQPWAFLAVWQGVMCCALSLSLRGRRGKLRTWRPAACVICMALLSHITLFVIASVYLERTCMWIVCVSGCQERMCCSGLHDGRMPCKVSKASSTLVYDRVGHRDRELCQVLRHKYCCRTCLLICRWVCSEDGPTRGALASCFIAGCLVVLHTCGTLAAPCTCAPVGMSDSLSPLILSGFCYSSWACRVSQPAGPVWPACIAGRLRTCYCTRCGLLFHPHHLPEGAPRLDHHHPMRQHMRQQVASKVTIFVAATKQCLTGTGLQRGVGRTATR